jgi:hypothetical protein
LEPSSNPSLSAVPSGFPSSNPSSGPSSIPSLSSEPSSEPSSNPSLSAVPSSDPSSGPSLSSQPSLSNVPTDQLPSDQPSAIPSSNPSLSMDPSQMPSADPSTVPSLVPSGSPSASSQPSLDPSGSPTDIRSQSPSDSPSLSSQPSLEPSSNPSLSAVPSGFPSSNPSSGPSSTPSLSSEPSTEPSSNPSQGPVLAFTSSPTGENACAVGRAPLESQPRDSCSVTYSLDPSNNILFRKAIYFGITADSAVNIDIAGISSIHLVNTPDLFVEVWTRPTNGGYCGGCTWDRVLGTYVDGDSQGSLTSISVDFENPITIPAGSRQMFYISTCANAGLAIGNYFTSDADVDGKFVIDYGTTFDAAKAAGDPPEDPNDSSTSAYFEGTVRTFEGSIKYCDGPPLTLEPSGMPTSTPMPTAPIAPSYFSPACANHADGGSTFQICVEFYDLHSSFHSRLDAAVAFWEGIIATSPVTSDTSPNIAGNCEGNPYSTFVNSYSGPWICGFHLPIPGTSIARGGRTFSNDKDPTQFGYIYWDKLDGTDVISLNTIIHELGKHRKRRTR